MGQNIPFLQQAIGNVILGTNSSANIGIFGHHSSYGHINSSQALFFKEMYHRQHEIPEETRGTCSWILENPQLRAWQSACSEMLWIQGGSGTGKSTTMKFLWKHVMHSPCSTRIVTSFFCHDRGMVLQKSATGIFRALLHQILQQVPSLKRSFESKFQTACEAQGPHGSKWDWTKSELKTFLKDHLLSCCLHAKVFVLIDALDECGEEDAREPRRFFQALVDMSKQRDGGLLKVCISSRHHTPARDSIRLVICLDEKSATDTGMDISQELERFRDNSQEYDKLLSAIIQHARNSFHEAVLILRQVAQSFHKGQFIEMPPQGLYQLFHHSSHSHYAEDNTVSVSICCLYQRVSLPMQPFSQPRLQPNSGTRQQDLLHGQLKDFLYSSRTQRYVQAEPSPERREAIEPELRPTIQPPLSGFIPSSRLSDSDKAHSVVDSIYHPLQNYASIDGDCQDFQDCSPASIIGTATLSIVEAYFRLTILFTCAVYCGISGAVQILIVLVGSGPSARNVRKSRALGYATRGAKHCIGDLSRRLAPEETKHQCQTC